MVATNIWVYDQSSEESSTKGSITTDIILMQRKREFIRLSCRDNGVLFGKRTCN
jgi:hypothetical protein